VLPETGLTRLFLDFSGDGSVYKLLYRYKTSETFSKEIISLVPRIIEIADNGDKVARNILASFTDELCGCFMAAMKMMNMEGRYCDIVLTGSVLMGRTNGLTGMIVKRISQEAKNANIINAKFEPVVGAFIMSVLKKSQNFNERLNRNIAVSAEKFDLLRMF
jgi:N-acetylglucosamine kinase-like BadF-type ATPase